MSTLVEIEEAIRRLPGEELLSLRDWINEKAEPYSKGEEDPVLETAILRALDSPIRPMDDDFFDEVRRFAASMSQTSVV